MRTVLEGDDTLLHRIKNLRCSECKKDCTIIVQLLLEQAVEESKITGQKSTRRHHCPCGTILSFDVTPPEARE